MQNQKVLILDFGGQYNQLIARRVRECGVYCEVQPYDHVPSRRIRAYESHRHHLHRRAATASTTRASPAGGSRSCSALGVPILGICYGCQLLAHNLGGRVTAAQSDSCT